MIKNCSNCKVSRHRNLVITIYNKKLRVYLRSGIDKSIEQHSEQERECQHEHEPSSGRTGCQDTTTTIVHMFPKTLRAEATDTHVLFNN